MKLAHNADLTHETDDVLDDDTDEDEALVCGFDGGKEECDDFVASNGLHYRW
jgi:hypothetical protein